MATVSKERFLTICQKELIGTPREISQPRKILSHESMLAEFHTSDIASVLAAIGWSSSRDELKRVRGMSVGQAYDHFNAKYN